MHRRRCERLDLSDRQTPIKQGRRVFPEHPVLLLQAISFTASFLGFWLWLGLEKTVFLTVVIFIHEPGHWLGIYLTFLSAAPDEPHPESEEHEVEAAEAANGTG
ncbi:MAG: hypothetical protein ACI9UA_003870 [Pseudoalteromonas tetraodonis]